MRVYYVYILKCSDNSYYTGITNNLEQRLTQHHNGIDTKAYVYKRRPVHLVWSADFTNPNKAIEIEKQIKGWSRRKKEALISGSFELLPSLSKKKF